MYAECYDITQLLRKHTGVDDSIPRRVRSMAEFQELVPHVSRLLESWHPTMLCSVMGNVMNLASFDTCAGGARLGLVPLQPRWRQQAGRRLARSRLS